MKPAFVNRRRDANEPAIIAALRAAGATVEQLSGPDLPDLLVGYDGSNYLLEVKTAKGKSRPGQLHWHGTWCGNCYVVREPKEALKLIGVRVR